METIKSLKDRMRFVERQVEDIINSLQNEDVEVIDVAINKTDVTSKDSSRTLYLFKVKIQTKII